MPGTRRSSRRGRVGPARCGSAKPQPPEPAITSAEYDVRVDNTGAHVVAKYTVRAFRAGESTVSLPLSDARLEGATVDGAPAFPTAARPDAYAIAVGGPGRHEIELRFAATVAANGPGEGAVRRARGTRGAAHRGAARRSAAARGRGSRGPSGGFDRRRQGGSRPRRGAGRSPAVARGCRRRGRGEGARGVRVGRDRGRGRPHRRVPRAGRTGDGSGGAVRGAGRVRGASRCGPHDRPGRTDPLARTGRWPRRGTGSGSCGWTSRRRPPGASSRCWSARRASRSPGTRPCGSPRVVFGRDRRDGRGVRVARRTGHRGRRRTGRRHRLPTGRAEGLHRGARPQARPERSGARSTPGPAPPRCARCCG